MQSFLRTVALVAAVGCTASAFAQDNHITPDEEKQGWDLLFDGVSLDQWTTAGVMWKAQDGELRTSEPGKGWWLRTKRLYRDFELKLDFVVPPNGNSGVGIRGSATGDPAFTGMEVQVFDSAGKPLADNVCGAVYNAIPPMEQAVKPAGEWNSYRIRLVGDTLNVWLNGVQVQKDQKLDQRGFVHDPKNVSPLADRLPTGYISLQDHGDVVRFKNIKIMDLSPDMDSGGWTMLGNGKDLDGFTKRGGGEWEWKDGSLVGSNGPGHLFTNKDDFTNFELRTFVRVVKKGNSGIYFRVHPKKEDPNTWPDGYEAQIDQHDPKNFTGVIYNRAYPADIKAPITRDEAWFDYRILAVGDQIQTWVNGVQMVDANLNNFPSGHIALQTHHDGNRIEFRGLSWRPVRIGSSGKPE